MDGVPELKPVARPFPPPLKSPAIPHLCMALILATGAPVPHQSPHDPPHSHLCVALTLLAASVIFAFGLFMMCPSSSTQ